MTAPLYLFEIGLGITTIGGTLSLIIITIHHYYTRGN